MSNIHPHWQTTDDEQPVPVRIIEPQNAQVAAVPAARRTPAAFIGVALFLLIGFVVFQGMNGIAGQVSGMEKIDIRLTPNGLQPAVVTVEPGQEIVWKNESTIPHILSSQTLKDEQGEEFETTAIFPQSEFLFVVPMGTSMGTYDYISETSASVIGQIIVDASNTGMQAAVHSSVTSSVSAHIPPAVHSSNSSAQPIPAAPAQASSFAFVPNQMEDLLAGSIPQNPNTIANGNALPVRQQSGRATSASTPSHKPISHAQTGMGLWMTFIAGMGAFVVIIKKASHRV